MPTRLRGTRRNRMHEWMNRSSLLGIESDERTVVLHGRRGHFCSVEESERVRDDATSRSVSKSLVPSKLPYSNQQPEEINRVLNNFGVRTGSKFIFPCASLPQSQIPLGFHSVAMIKRKRTRCRDQIVSHRAISLYCWYIVSYHTCGCIFLMPSLCDNLSRQPCRRYSLTTSTQTTICQHAEY